MAASKNDVVTQFSELLKRERFAEVSKEFAALVKQLGSGRKFLTPEEEQKLRLQPTKAFKKVSKLMENKEVGRGILSVPVRSPPHGLPILRALAKICGAPHLGSQVASCGLAHTLKQCADPVFQPLANRQYQPKCGSESFLFETVCIYLSLVTDLLESGPAVIEEVFQHRLASQLFSLSIGPKLSPVAVTMEGPVYWGNLIFWVAQTIRSFLTSEDKSRRLLKEVPAEKLARWLGGFLSHIRVVVINTFFHQNDMVEEGAGIVCHYISQQAFLQPLLHTSARSLLEQAVHDLLPVLVEPEAKTHAEYLARIMTQKTPEEAFACGPKQDLTEEGYEAIRGLVQKIKGSSGAELAKNLVSFQQEMQLRVVTDHVKVILFCGPIDVLMAVFKREAEGSSVKTSSFGGGALALSLELLSLFLGIADSTSCLPAAVFDIVGETLLGKAVPALDRLGQNTQAYLQVLVFCFNSGQRMQLRTRDLMDAVVSCLDSDVPNRSAGVLGWHFLGVLVGAIPYLEGSAFGLDEAPGGQYVSVYWSRHGEPFKARHAKIPSGVMERKKGSKVARLALRAFNQFQLSHELVGMWPSGAACVLDKLCQTDPSLLQEQVVEKVHLIVALLERAHSSLANPSEQLAQSQPDIQKIEAKQQAAICVALASLLTLCVENPKVDQQSLIVDIAKAKGIDLCRSVMRVRRTKAASLSDSLRAISLQGAEAERLWALVEVLWGRMATRFDLRACSSPGCRGDIIESKTKTFKKCSACGSTQYCSKSCQLEHWKMEHKVQCKERASSKTASTTETAP